MPPMNTPIKVIEIAFTAYAVTDMARARSFYEGVFNLKETSCYEEEGMAWVEYEVGAATLALTNFSTDRWKPSNDGPSTALEVEDFEGAVAAVREFGSPFYVEPIDTGVCQLAIIGDPDGNSLVIHKRKPQDA